MTELAHDGVTVRLGSRDWVVPPLNLRQLRRLAPKFQHLGAVGAGMAETQIDVLVEIAHAALSRNYPALTSEEVSELIDLGNAMLLIKAIVGASGLVPAAVRAASFHDAEEGALGAPASRTTGGAPLGEVAAGQGSAGTD